MLYYDNCTLMQKFWWNAYEFFDCVGDPDMCEKCFAVFVYLINREWKDLWSTMWTVRAVLK